MCSASAVGRDAHAIAGLESHLQAAVRLTAPLASLLQKYCDAQLGVPNGVPLSTQCTPTLRMLSRKCLRWGSVAPQCPWQGSWPGLATACAEGGTAATLLSAPGCLLLVE